MSPQFIARPPLAVQRNSMWKYVWQTLVRIRLVLWQIVTPFNSRPEEIDSLPDPTIEVSESLLQQCQWIFDQAEARRLQLEQKAQSTFGLMLFLVPLLASLFAFVISKATPFSTVSHALAIIWLFVSFILLVLGFISAVRAVAVKTVETLFLQSVIQEDGQFREYNRAFHARGLLYCASMNTAMNDHIAQFVKGAHMLTAVAVGFLILAAVPISLVFSGQPSSPSMEVKVVDPVKVSSSELTALRDEVINLRKDIATQGNCKAAEDRLKLLEEKVARLETRPKKTSPAVPVNEK